MLLQTFELYTISALQHSEGEARTVHVALNPAIVTELSDENSTIKKPVSGVKLLGRVVPLLRKICCLVAQFTSVQELNVT